MRNPRQLIRSRWKYRSIMITPINSIVIPLHVDGYSGWAIFDSVSYIGSRLENIAILDSREVISFGTDGISVDSLALKFINDTGTPLPAGDGKICELWFSPRYGGDITLEQLPTSPYGALSIIPESGSAYTPEFLDGSISIECDYSIGNVRPDGSSYMDDMYGLFKGYLGCLGSDWGNPWNADMNCDRLIDARDGCIMDLFIRGIIPEIICDCGSYNPTSYTDPGQTDTVWIESDTLYVGVLDTIDIGIINDEILWGFSFAFEWGGTAVLESDYSLIGRIADIWYVFEYQCAYYYDGLSPDSLYLSTYFDFGDHTFIPPGREAVIQLECTPISPGTITFDLTHYPDFEELLTPGAGSMLVDEYGGGILPVFVGGEIVVLPLPCGDANGDTQVNVSDAVAIINYVFAGGNPPDPIELGDVNCDGNCNVSDAVYLINFVFGGGNPPCDTDGDGTPDC